MPFQSHKKPFILDPKKSARKAYEYAVYDDDFEPSGEDEESFRVVTNHFRISGASPYLWEYTLGAVRATPPTGTPVAQTPAITRRNEKKRVMKALVQYLGLEGRNDWTTDNFSTIWCLTQLTNGFSNNGAANSINGVHGLPYTKQNGSTATLLDFDVTCSAHLQLTHPAGSNSLDISNLVSRNANLRHPAKVIRALNAIVSHTSTVVKGDDVK